ncbi:MAG: hypothetical protein JNJ47_06785, partial [Alphaproteobacteria bacterium]|nr:hypothetical protein [Alphaproteobacteria bacterium]
IPEVILSARFTPWIMQGAAEIKRIVPHDYLPQDFAQPTINPLDAKDLIENSLPSLEDTVKNLSTLRPVSPKKSTENNKEMEALIDSTTPDNHPESP